MNTVAQRRWMLGAMFLAGLISGVACAAGVAWHFLPPPGIPSGDQVIERVRKDLRRDLDLTSEQERDLEPALVRHAQQLDVIRRDMLARVLRSIQEKNEKVEQILTPTQRERFREGESRRLRRFERQ